MDHWSVHCFSTDMATPIATTLLCLSTVIIIGTHLHTCSDSIRRKDGAGSIMLAWRILASTYLTACIINLVSIFTEHHTHLVRAAIRFFHHSHTNTATSIRAALLANVTATVYITHVDTGTQQALLEGYVNWT